LITAREFEVLACAAEGLTVKETAKKLHIGVETVKSHRRRIIAQLGARSITHSIALAFHKGILRVG